LTLSLGRGFSFASCAQQLGFSLEEIDTLLDLASGDPDSCTAAKSLATEKLAQLSATRDSLGQLVATCEKARDQRLCPLLDAVETHEETQEGDDG
jgi:DNA-binding transcriptional MerR regulator